MPGVENPDVRTVTKLHALQSCEEGVAKGLIVLVKRLKAEPHDLQKQVDVEEQRNIVISLWLKAMGYRNLTHCEGGTGKKISQP
eukprot:6100444-Amphidinium_carterae.1